MSDVLDIEEFAVKEYSELLARRGFAPAKILRDEAKTRIEFLQADFAIEVELDWRDFMAFVLVVRLEDGRLPGGYYMSQGRRCRKHLAKIIKEQKWEAPAGPRFDRGRPKPADAADLKNILLSYKGQLSACIDRLAVAGHSVV